MSRFIGFIIHHRWLVLAVTVGITLLAGYSISRAVIATSFGELLLGAHPQYEQYVEDARGFFNDEQLIVGWEDPDAVSEESVARLREIVAALDAIPEVRRVLHPLPTLEGQLAGPDAEPGLLARVWTEIGRGIVISDDAQHLAVVVELDPKPDRPIERTPQIVEEIIEAFETAGIPEQRLHFGGMLSILREIKVQTERNIIWLTPLVGVALLGATFLLVGRLWPVALTGAVGLLAIIWTMGFAVAIDRQLNMLIAIAPSIIMIIAFSDVIHLFSAYRLELAAGREKEDAIIAAGSEVGLACVYTSITTFVGFLSLSLINVPGFRMFGLILGFGVAMALLLALVLVPVVLSILPIAERREPGPVGAVIVGGVEGVLGTCRRLALERPWLVIVFSGVLIAGAIVSTLRIEVETDFTKRFGSDARLARDVEYFNTHFAGTGVVDLYLTPTDDATLLDADDAARLMSLVDAIEAEPAIGRTISAIGVARAASQTDNPERIAAWLNGAAHLPGPMSLRALHDPETGRLRVAMLLREHGVRETSSAGEMGEALAASHLDKSWAPEASGMMVLAGLWLEEHLKSQRIAIVISLIMIAVVLAFAFRSIRVSAVAMIPNLVPLLAVAGVLGLVWRVVDSDAAIAVVVALSIAVDDTIHFVTRAQLEAKRARENPDASQAEITAAALERTFRFAGRAIVMTSLIFAVGFIPMVISDYLPFRMLGVLLPAAMLAALLGDLLLLPALLRIRLARV